VKVHRSRLMRKMKAHSLPELGRMADKLKLVPNEQTSTLIGAEPDFAAAIRDAG
jgi:hypothetical protein